MDLKVNAMEIASITKETRWDSDSVRNMCIKHNFYTRGTVEAYSQMLNYVDCKRHNPSKAVIYLVARDIVRHSDLDAYNQTEAENIESVMFELVNECINTFFHIDKEEN